MNIFKSDVVRLDVAVVVVVVGVPLLPAAVCCC